MRDNKQSDKTVSLSARVNPGAKMIFRLVSSGGTQERVSSIWFSGFERVTVVSGVTTNIFYK